MFEKFGTAKLHAGSKVHLRQMLAKAAAVTAALPVAREPIKIRKAKRKAAKRRR
jgi:hypothetical protein